MKLPTERKEPDMTVDGDMFLIIGEPKAGKSTLASGVPDCLVIDTQGGHNKLPSMSLDLREEARNQGKEPMDIFKQAMVMLKKNCPYKAVCIDTLDDISVMAEDLAVKNCNADNAVTVKGKAIGDFTYGKGYAEHRGIVMSILTVLRSLPCTVILIAHNKRMIDEDTSEVTKVLDLPGRLAHHVPGEVDHIGIASKSKKGFVLSFEGYESERSGKKSIMQAGSRNPHLNGKVIETSWDAILETAKGND